MSSFVLCVGCGTPLYGFSPYRWCTCERCGVDLRDGICPLCNSMNSCAYDPNPNSFDCPPDSYHPPHPTYETYSGDTCGNDYRFGYDCPPQFSLNYEPESGYTQNYNSCPHDSPSFPQQYPCCDDCGVTQSMLNRDSSVISSSLKIDSLLDEFVGELTLLKSIPPGIDKADCHPKNEIRFSKRLLYDNSSPRPPKEFVFENSNAEIESFLHLLSPLRIVTLI
nr:hypothetical protein [Tanacetum cinerariifolium]